MSFNFNVNTTQLFDQARAARIPTLAQAHPILNALVHFSNEELFEMDPRLPQWVADQIRACSRNDYMRKLLILAGIEPNPGPMTLSNRFTALKRKRTQKQNKQKSKPKQSRGPVPLNRARGTPNRSMSIRGNSQDVYITKREYIGQFASTATGFHLIGLSGATPGYDGNPACPAMFPWLSTIAGAFEKYSFSRLRIELVGAASAMVGGNFYAAWDYDYDDPVPANGMLLLSNTSSIRCSPFETAGFDVDTRRMNSDLPTRFVMRAGRLSAEPRTTYCGYLVVGAENVAVGTSISVWINYTVKLSIPTLESPAIQTFSTTLAADAGTGNYRLMPGGALTPGPITAVVPGVNNVPPVTIPGVGQPSNMLALGNVSTGLLTLLSADTVTGSTPTTVVPSVYADAALIDRAGATIGYLSDAAIGGDRATGAANPTSWTVTGASINSLLSVAIGKVKLAFPGVVYLAPFIAKTVTPWAAGNKQWTINYVE